MTIKYTFPHLKIFAFLFISSLVSNAQVGIGTLTPATTLEVDGQTTDAIYGHSNNVGGYLGYETNITIPAFLGLPAQTVQGSGVYANNPASGYTSSFSQSTGNADVAAAISYSDVWMAGYNYVNNSSNVFNPSALYAQLNVSNNTLGGYKAAFNAYSFRGTTSGNPGYTVGGLFTADAQNEDAIGISANVFSNRNPNNSGILSPDLAGGEFLVFNYNGTTLRSLAWVANYNDRTDYKILGTGTVSTIIEDENNDARIMFAPEAPEVLFQDYGVGQLTNGIARITIDPILAKNIFVDASHPLKVFIQLEGDCNGVYVTDKSKDGFTVKELQNGTSNVTFSYQIVANRINRKNSNIASDSEFHTLRFPKLNNSKDKLKKKLSKEDFSKAMTKPKK